MDQKKWKILWIDDEIELLRPHIILLKQREYDVFTATNGEDAIELARNQHFDMIFLDEMMVGISGLETLTVLKDIDSNTPVIMVTKNEAESLMEEAIGLKIDDYLTKPVNPAQILAACKKFLEAQRIGTEKFTQNYLMGFNEISQRIMDKLNWTEWLEIYIKLVNWSMELDKYTESGMQQTLQDQWRDCNAAFSKFVEDNYVPWLNGKGEPPILSHQILDKYLTNHIKTPGPTFFFVIDCMRLDQWLVMEELLSTHYTFKTDYYSSILPTATPYSRNAIFAGMTPLEIKKYYPQWWSVDSNSEDHKQNAYEKDLLESWLQRKRTDINKINFIKIFDTEFGKKIEREITQYTGSPLTAIVLNAVDMIAHSRSDYAILKEIAPDESAYRSLTRSWFMHSSLFGMLKTLSTIKNIKIVITTDHGSIRCMRGVKVLGDRDTSTCLRYKFGKNVKAEQRHAIQISDPEIYKIPRTGITVNNIIAKEDYYFVYPTDYHHYLQRYRDSFQHGGISLEEMILPVITLEPK
ncbi:MAG: bifunctional response regulator/alkaline phosphatase family protein [Candidatus Kapabacteria bacterium]|nr:bifunctional response regulator/alkaline phosphatase family protein [Candidatus Kapabacteria bacterium]